MLTPTPLPLRAHNVTTEEKPVSNESKQPLNLDEVAQKLEDFAAMGYGQTTSVVIYIDGQRHLVHRIHHAEFFDNTGTEREVAFEVTPA